MLLCVLCACSTAVAEQARLEELVGREAARQHSFMVMIHRCVGVGARACVCTRMRVQEEANMGLQRELWYLLGFAGTWRT